jgi:methionyl-tRNA formyltransferase
MRVIVCAMRCPASIAAVQALLAGGQEIAAIVVPGARAGAAFGWSRPPGATRGLPLAGPPTIDALAARAGIPVALLGDPASPAAHAALADLAAEAIVVACYPRRLPARLVAVAPRGAINIHPSPLPLLRGPEPLFHALRLGWEETVVCVHVLTDAFDAGDILARAPYAFPAGARLAEIEAATGALGGQLAARVLDDLVAGRATPAPQDDRRATAAPSPTAAYFVVPTAWDARRAWAFVRAVAPLGGPLRVVDAAGDVIAVTDALAWSPDGPDRLPSAPPAADTVDIAFSPGRVRFLRN